MATHVERLVAGLALVCSTACKTAPPNNAATDAPTADVAPDAVAAVFNPCRPFAMPSADALFASDKKVFAHYFYPFPLSMDNAVSAQDYYNRNYLSPTGESSKWVTEGGYLRARPLPVTPSTSTTWQIDNMKTEVRMAIAAGITGFTVDVLAATEVNPGSQLQNLLTAAAAVDSRFRIVVMPDIAALETPSAAVVESIISSVATSPAAYHLTDGRLVVTAFDASLETAAFWSGVMTDLSTAGIDVAFVPTFLGWSANATAYAPFSYGFSDWGTATPTSSTNMQVAPGQAHALGKIFMMPVDPQQYRPKDFAYWEAGNSAAFRDAWTSAITGDADWIQLVTWGDFSESSQIEPYTDATLATDIGTGYYDMNAYYASWFLTGAAPTITEDALFYFYRREALASLDPAQTTPTHAVGTAGTDNIEVVGFLAAPGTLEITIGGHTYTQDAPAGVTSFSVPLATGTPQFGLVRDGTEVVSAAGTISIVDALPSGTLDLTYWSGSVSAAGTCEITPS
jgi:Glycosyl hydrolase family 71